jgi:hypothetical protein
MAKRKMTRGAIWCREIAPFVIFLLAIILVIILRPMASDCPFCHFSFGHCKKKNDKRGNLMP